MSRITGNEPKHWHDPKGRHRMSDPRDVYSGAAARHHDRDEQLYARHLEVHEILATDPEPLRGDPPAVAALFAHIESLEAVIAKEKQLVIALRQQAAQAPEEGDGE
jgi:hypothetical protein